MQLLNVQADAGVHHKGLIGLAGACCNNALPRVGATWVGKMPLQG